MEKKITKKDLVKILVHQDLETTDEEELIDVLLNQPLAIDVDKKSDEEETFGDRMADKLTEIAGSWAFILGFVSFLLFWIILNSYIDNVDPYPFTLLNLILSCVAALQAPVIMMSQNRAAKRDSLRSKNDYQVDLKSELILEELHKQMDEILKNQKKILKTIEEEK